MAKASSAQSVEHETLNLRVLGPSPMLDLSIGFLSLPNGLSFSSVSLDLSLLTQKMCGMHSVGILPPHSRRVYVAGLCGATWSRIVCLRGRLLVQSQSVLSIVRMDETQPRRALSNVRMDKSQSSLAVHCVNGRVRQSHSLARMDESQSHCRTRTNAATQRASFGVRKKTQPSSRITDN